jgi:hypothetical protein
MLNSPNETQQIFRDSNERSQDRDETNGGESIEVFARTVADGFQK